MSPDLLVGNTNRLGSKLCLTVEKDTMFATSPLQPISLYLKPA